MPCIVRSKKLAILYHVFNKGNKITLIQGTLTFTSFTMYVCGTCLNSYIIYFRLFIDYKITNISQRLGPVPPGP